MVYRQVTILDFKFTPSVALWESKFVYSFRLYSVILSGGELMGLTVLCHISAVLRVSLEKYVLAE